MTNGNQNAVVMVTANDVTIDGVALDGDDPLATAPPPVPMAPTPTTYSGVDANTLFDVSNFVQTPAYAEMDPAARNNAFDKLTWRSPRSNEV